MSTDVVSYKYPRKCRSDWAMNHSAPATFLVRYAERYYREGQARARFMAKPFCEECLARACQQMSEIDSISDMFVSPIAALSK